MSIRKLLLTACACVGVLFTAACNNPELAGGKLHFDQERYGQAEENFKLAVEASPENTEARMFLAMSQAEQGKDEEASANFAKAAEMAPENEAVGKNRLHYFGDRYNSALAYNDEAKDLMDGGDENGAKGKYREAIKEFNRALLYNPESKETYENLGVMYFRVDEIDKALESFDRLYQIAPDDEDVLATLQDVYSGRGNDSFQKALDKKRDKDDAGSLKYFEAAMAFYDKAMEMNQDDIDVQQNRAAVAWELADLVPEKKDMYLAEAKKGYGAVFANEPTNEGVLLNLSLLANSTGDTDEALKYAKQLVDMDPKNAKYHVNEGRIHGTLDNKSEMFGGLLMGQALQQGIVQEISKARAMAEAHGPRSDMLGRYREYGDPEEIRVFKDAGGGEYQVFFYWERGLCFAFQDGAEVFKKSFRKIEADAGATGD